MIFHIIFTRGLAGAERSALNTVATLIKSGNSAKLILLFDQRFTTLPDKERLLSECTKKNVPYEVLEIDRRFSWSMLRSFIDLLRRASVVHSHGYKSDLYILLAHGILWPSLSRRRLITTQHGFANGGVHSFLVHHVGILLKLFFHRIVVVSHDLKKNHWINKYCKRCIVIKNFIVEQLFSEEESRHSRQRFLTSHGISTENKIAGWLGRLDSVKGPDIFLKSLQRVEGPLTVLMGGVGPLANLVMEAKLPSQIQFHYLQSVSDTNGFFASLDLFVLSSRCEGTPMVILEAVDARVPYIAAKIGGIPDMTSPENQRWLFDKEDEVALGHLIDEMQKQDCDSVSQMTKANYEFVKYEFSEKKFIKDLLTAYDQEGDRIETL